MRKSFSTIVFVYTALWLAILLPIVTSQSPTSFLRRFPERATNKLGERLGRFFGRIEQFFVPQDTVSNARPSAPPLGNGGSSGTLPGGNNVSPATYQTVVEVPANRAKATSTLIVLHGMGGSPQELRIMAFFARIHLPRTRFVFVKAPTQYVTYMRKRTSSWFNIDRRLPGFENVAELRSAAAGVSKIVRAELEKHQIPGNKVVVLGMSQGGAVALTFYLAEPTRVAGVIGTATWLPLPTKWERSALPADNAGTPCYIQHGTEDAVIPLAEASGSARKLKALGRSTKFKAYAGGGHALLERFSAVVTDIFEETKRMINE